MVHSMKFILLWPIHGFISKLFKEKSQQRASGCGSDCTNNVLYGKSLFGQKNNIDHCVHCRSKNKKKNNGTMATVIRAHCTLLQCIMQSVRTHKKFLINYSTVNRMNGPIVENEKDTFNKKGQKKSFLVQF